VGYILPEENILKKLRRYVEEDNYSYEVDLLSSSLAPNEYKHPSFLLKIKKGEDIIFEKPVLDYTAEYIEGIIIGFERDIKLEMLGI
jgi:hypothetical protein